MTDNFMEKAAAALQNGIDKYERCDKGKPKSVSKTGFITKILSKIRHWGF